jgi:hypothetical protein
MTKTEQNEFLCNHCRHPAHCGHGCSDETCDHCPECACVHCQAAYRAEEREQSNRGYN